MLAYACVRWRMYVFDFIRPCHLSTGQLTYVHPTGRTEAATEEDPQWQPQQDLKRELSSNQAEKTKQPMNQSSKEKKG